MVRFPEVIQFRVLPGTGAVIARLAEAEGKKPADILREAIQLRLAGRNDPSHNIKKAA